MIGRKIIQRIWVTNFLFWILVSLIAVQSLPLIAAKPEDLFPESMDDVITANYTNHQTMLHWIQGKFTGAGNYTLNYTATQDGLFEILGQYDVRFWQKACDAAAVYNGTTIVSVNKTDRYILDNSKRVGSVNLQNQFTNLFLGRTLQGNYFKLFFLEELLYISGVVHSEVFEFVGYNQITFQNEAINTTKMMWIGQLFYAGSICGMGLGPIFNCSFEYFYETRSGILVYSRVKIYQYLPDEPTIYQIHDFTNELTALSFTGQKDPDTNVNALREFFSDPASNSAFWPIIGMIGIIISGILAILFIRKKSLQRQARAFLEYEEKRLYGIKESSSKNGTNVNTPNDSDKTAKIETPNEKKDNLPQSDK